MNNNNIPPHTPINMAPMNAGDQAFYLRQKRLLDFLNERRIVLKCVMCGTVGGFQLIGYKHETTVIPTSTLGQYYPTYAAACGHCGFIHEFFAPIVDFS
ncbi:hypothetical protein WSS15_23370 [Acetobacter pasteurianus]|nr:hypothetical protein WSS15_23370 [Acetobacter pasteurianus]